MAYVIPPDTRAVDEGNPPEDINDSADMLGLITCILAGMAGYPGKADPDNNATNVTNLQTLKSISATVVGLAPSGDTSGATDTANIQALLNLGGGQVVQLQAGTFYTDGPLSIPKGTILRGALPVGQSVNGVSTVTGTRITAASGWAAGDFTDPGILYVDGVSNACVRNIIVDGSGMGDTSANGITLYGNCGSTTILDSAVYSATNNGISFISVSSEYPDGSELVNVVVYEPASNGITGSIIDCTFDNVHVQQAGGDAFYVQGSNDRFTGCQADQSSNGFVFDEFMSQGGCNLLANCGTAGNEKYGLYAYNSSTNSNSPRVPVIATGCTFNGDGANSGDGGGGYSALAAYGVSTLICINCNVFVNTNVVSDGCPEYALTTAKAGSGGPELIQCIGGIWNAVTGLYDDAADTATLRIAVDGYVGGMYSGGSSTPLTAYVVNGLSTGFLCTPSVYAPGTQTTLSTTSATLAAVSSADVNTGDFVVPASGGVLVRANFVIDTPTSSQNIAFALADHGEVTPVSNVFITSVSSSAIHGPLDLSFVVTGLTAGDTANFDLLFATAADTLDIYAYGTTSTTPTGTVGGPVTMTVQAI
jgi:hypothetical protein